MKCDKCGKEFEAEELVESGANLYCENCHEEIRDKTEEELMEETGGEIPDAVYTGPEELRCDWCDEPISEGDEEEIDGHYFHYELDCARHFFGEEEYALIKIKGFLSEKKGYPMELIKQEYPVNLGKIKRKIDLVVLNKDKKPRIIIETKGEIYEEDFHSTYNFFSDVLIHSGAKYGILTDSENYFFYGLDRLMNEVYTIQDIPRFGEEELQSNKQIEVISFELLIKRLMKFLFKQAISKQQAFEVLMDLLMCKLYDEKEKIGLFLPRSTSIQNVNKLYGKVKLENPDLYPANYDFLNRLRKDIVNYLIKSISIFSFSDPPITLYPEKQYSNSESEDLFIRTNYSTQGEGFFDFLEEELKIGFWKTPDYIIDFMTDLLRPKKDNIVCDLFCRLGRSIFCLRENMASNNIFGFHNQTTVLKFLRFYAGLKGLNTKQLILSNVILDDSMDKFSNKFDYIFLDPPVNAKLPFYSKKGGDKTSLTTLYLKKGFNFLKEGGEIAVILPEEGLIKSSTKNIRNFIKERFMIRAIISLGNNSDVYDNKIKYSLLILRKLKDIPKDYELFLAHEKYEQGTFDNEDYEYSHTDTLGLVNNYQNFKNYGKIEESDEVFILNINGLGDIWSPQRYSPRKLKKEKEFMNKGFEIYDLKDISSIIAGVSKYEENEDYLHLREAFEDSKIPVIKIKDFAGTAGGSLANKKDVPLDKILQDRDILISISASVGKVTKGSLFPKKATVSSDVAIIRPRDNIMSKYLYFALKSDYVTSQIENLTSGLTIRHISLSNLGKIRIPIPSIDKQREIVNRLSEIESKIQEAKSEIENHEKQKEELNKAYF